MQIMERVLGLGEDNQLASVAVGVDHQRVVEDPIQLCPLRIPARTQHTKRLFLKSLERIDLKAKLFDGFRRCRSGYDKVLKIVDFVLSVFVQVLQDLVVHRHGAETARPALRGEPGFGKFAFEPFTPPLEGSMDRGRRGRQPALQDLVRQANWQKVGGASPPERRSNRTTFLREPCVGSREGAGEASVAAWMGRAIEHRKSDGPGCRGFQIGRRQYRRRRFGEMSASPAVSENPCTFARLLLGPWEVFKLSRLS